MTPEEFKQRASRDEGGHDADVYGRPQEGAGIFNINRGE
jgi:hypothetical protein